MILECICVPVGSPDPIRHRRTRSVPPKAGWQALKDRTMSCLYTWYSRLALKAGNLVRQTFLWLRGYASVGQALLSDRTDKSKKWIRRKCLFYRLNPTDIFPWQFLFFIVNILSTWRRSSVGQSRGIIILWSGVRIPSPLLFYFWSARACSCLFKKHQPQGQIDKLMHSSQGTPKTDRQDACSTDHIKCILFLYCIFCG